LRSCLTVILSGVLSAALTYLFIRWAGSRAIVAVENHRSMHKGAVPVGGGLPLIVAALAALLGLWGWGGLPPALLPALAVLVLVSWRDDVKAVSPALRLAVHAGAAAAAVLALPTDALVFQGLLPLPLDRLLAAVALVWFINLTNFMDGIDGIASVEIGSIALGYAAVTWAAGGLASSPYYGLALAVAGAAAGFLVWNWSPARIFLGDVGSVPLGFLAGFLMLDLATRHSLVAALALPLYFVADATITLARRILAGARPWDAHRTHYYQRAAAALGSHAAVVKRLVVCNGILLIAAVLAVTAPLPAVVLAAGAVGLLLWTLECAATRRPE
jgi:UDP-N-acetylmuramyl pentapeptide phosphotransferase/UDP-N-acetylglucosamine-1-phosphate transferase